MAKYKYQARTQGGELQAGFIEAATSESAANILRSHNLFILSLAQAEKEKWYNKFFRLFGRVRVRDLMVFSRQFAILLESQVPLGDSLRALHRQTQKPLLKEAIFEVSQDIDAGLSLSQALERQGNIFSEFYINMIRPAEVTGRLEQAMVFLADYLEKESIWISRIRNAMIYPVIVIALFMIVAGMMLVTVFPQIGPIFEESGVDVPFITKIFLGTGNFIIKWWLAILLVVVLLIFLITDYLKSDEGRIVSNEIKVRLPVFGNLYRKVYVARFAETLSALIKGGIPMAQGIEVAGRSIQNIVYEEVLREVAEGVKRGESFSSLLSQNEYYFPPLVGQMLAVGEGAGRINEVLMKIASLYSREVDDVLDSLAELIQPVLVMIIGIFVGLLFASILIPIYNLAKAF